MILDFMVNIYGEEAIISETACEKVVVTLENGSQRVFKDIETAHKKLMKMGYWW